MCYELFIEQASLYCCTSAIEKDDTTQIGRASVGLCKTLHTFYFCHRAASKMLILFANKKVWFQEVVMFLVLICILLPV